MALPSRILSYSEIVEDERNRKIKTRRKHIVPAK